MPYDGTDFTSTKPAFKPIYQERLAKLSAHLRQLPPAKFSMHSWDSDGCCCIGGTADKLFSRWFSRSSQPVGDLLGLSSTQRQALFYPCRNSAWVATAQQAANVVDYLALTGKVDWDRMDG